jgi:hypothetical protein
LVVELAAALARRAEQYLSQRRAVNRKALANPGGGKNRLLVDLGVYVNDFEGIHLREVNGFADLLSEIAQDRSRLIEQ